MCPVCKKASRTRQALKQHVVMHMPKGAAGYRCPIVYCGEYFTRKSNYDEHYRQHTNRRIPCAYEKCKKTFKTERTAKVSVWFLL